jgi:2'-5' RNA ligase
MARLRTFIAVDLGKPIRERLEALQRTLGRSSPEVKWVERDNLHITLLFLGEVDERDISQLCQTVANCCASHRPFEARVQSVGSFPNLRRPRTLWVGIEQGKQELCKLHDDLEPPLLDLGCYRREERRYTPHVTLGRVRGNRPADSLAQALREQQTWEGGTVLVPEILVLSSELTPQGPIYTVLSRAPLGAASDGVCAQRWTSSRGTGRADTSPGSTGE